MCFRSTPTHAPPPPPEYIPLPIKWTGPHSSKPHIYRYKHEVILSNNNGVINGSIKLTNGEVYYRINHPDFECYQMSWKSYIWRYYPDVSPLKAGLYASGSGFMVSDTLAANWSTVPYQCIYIKLISILDCIYLPIMYPSEYIHARFYYIPGIYPY